MSAHTGETEVELETPTPPKLCQSINRRNEEVIEEESVRIHESQNEDLDEEDEETDDESDDSEVEGNYRYYETDSDDPFSGEIACCLSCPSFGCLKSSDAESTISKNNSNSVHVFMLALCSQISVLGFISLSVTWLIIGYLLPACMCGDLFQHIVDLPFAAKLIIFVLLLFFAFLTWFCYHTFQVISQKQANGLFGMLIMLISLILASVISNTVFIYRSGGWTNYQLYNPQFYSKAGDVFSFVSNKSSRAKREAHFKFIQNDMIAAVQTFTSIKSDKLEDVLAKVFYEEGLAQIESLERLIKWSVLGGWFIFNIFLGVVIFNVIKYRKMYYDGRLEENLDQSRSSLKSRASRRSRTSHKSKKSRTSANHRDRPPSYRHISPPKSEYSVHTARTVKSTTSRRKLRNFNQSDIRNSFAAPISESHYSSHAPIRYQPNDSFRTLQNPRRAQEHYVEVHNPYHTIQKKTKRTNQEDFLY